MLDTQTQTLGAKLDTVIQLAQQRLAGETEAWKLDCYQLILRNFGGLRRSLDQGQLSEHFVAGAGFGASKAISEWDLGDDEIWQAVMDAEDYYRQGH
ncbi:hypothetical protein [Sphingomonas sp.]|uniref:hypothetical protein n=1 Tax=Sphingomonas sp. TaxID=28214 RepID=UPI0025DC9856|nr:hypothetical protein [Sphingomonas sp.]